MQIDFAAMQVGDQIALPGYVWNAELSKVYDDASAYGDSKGGAVQFEIQTSWQTVDGVQRRKFTLVRIR